MINDLTTGNPLKLLIQFAIPLLIGNIFIQLCHISDMIIVGHMIGVNALASVGSSAPLYAVILMVAFGLCGGLTVITAQRFGAKDEDGVRKSVFHGILASSVISVVTTILLLIFLDKLLHLMNIPQTIFTDAYDFMFILLLSLPIIVFYNLISGFIRALGDSRTPLYFLILSSLLNIILNYILIKFFQTGIKGSAYATLISGLISAVLCYIYMWKKFPLLRLSKKFMRYNPQIMHEHIGLALPMALQYSILSFSIMIVQSVCNSFGENVIASFATALRVEILATQPLITLGMAVATYSAQNWGANLLSRIRRGVKSAFIISTTISITCSVLAFCFGEHLISIFIADGNQFIIDLGKKYLVTSTLFYFFFGLIFVFRNTIQGMGKPALPLLSSITELITRSIIAIYLAQRLGYEGIFYASPSAWTASGLLVVCGYFYYIHKLSKDAFRWKIGEVRQQLNETTPID